MESNSVWKGLLFGGIGGCWAETLVFPLDVVKTRLQMQGADGKKLYDGMFDAMRKTAKSEGVGALYKGIQPALLRQAVYGSLRYGLYAPIRNAIGVSPNVSKDQIPFHLKFIAGGSSGALASFIANPTDLLKVRMQVTGMDTGTTKYRGLVGGFAQLVRDEGILGLWRGSGPNIARATVLAAVELSTYDTIKQALIAANMVEPGTPSGVFVSALCTGFIASVVSNPFDVVKSRMMGQPVGSDGKGTLYKNMLDCTTKSVRNEGVMCLQKGFFPCWARLGPRAMIIFQTMEFLKRNFDSPDK